jgi:hypothetical protein
MAFMAYSFTFRLEAEQDSQSIDVRFLRCHDYSELTDFGLGQLQSCSQ